MKLYENGIKINKEPKTIKEAKEMIAGLDLSMATVDCDYQEYKLINTKGKIVYSRPHIHVP